MGGWPDEWTKHFFAVSDFMILGYKNDKKIKIHGIKSSAYPLAGDQMGVSEDDRWLVSGKIVIRLIIGHFKRLCKKGSWFLKRVHLGSR